MILYVRMVRRDLKSDIQRNLDVVLLCPAHQRSKLIQCAEVRVNTLMAAFLAAYGPRAANIRRFNDHRIILAFAKGHSYRMNRGEIDDIETHPRDVRDHASQSLKVPCWPEIGDADLGKNSYHEPKRARTGSTAIVSSLS